MAFLLALAVAATALMAQPWQLVSAARTSPAAEAFWRAALPDAPMPNAIRELLQHPDTDVANGVAEANYNDKDPPPPMNFNYDDYRALPRSEATTAPSPDVLNHAGVVLRKSANGEDSAAAPSSTLFFLEDAVLAGESLPFHSPDRATADAPPLRLYTVRSVRAVDGSSFVVCRRGSAVYGCRSTGPARAYVLTLTGGERGDEAAMNAAAVCRTDTSPGDPEQAALRLLGVNPGGVAAVCHAVPDAQVLPVVFPNKNVKNPPAN